MTDRPASGSGDGDPVAENTIPPPEIDGVVRTDSVTQQLYSTDASIYKCRPSYVVFPFNRSDVEILHRWSLEHSVTLIPRGGGTSLSGQSIGRGAVVDYSRHFDGILEWKPEEERVRVQPGVVLETLNEYLESEEFQFGPDVATANRATIGGMIGNNSAGAHSIRHGRTSDHVHSLECVLYNGESVTFEPLTLEEAERRASQSNLEGRIYRRIPDLVEDYDTEIRDRFPEIMRNVSGYGVDRFLEKLDEGIVDFTELVCGSEGTLGAVVEAELDVVPAVESTALLVLECESLDEAVRANRLAVDRDPLAVELLDEMLLELAGDSLEFSRYLDWMDGDPEAVLIVEIGEEPDRPSLEDQVREIEIAFEEGGFDGTVHSFFDESSQERIWTVRKSGLPLLLGISGDRKPTTFVEDTAVDPDDLAEYVSDFQDLVAEHGTQAAYYGHSSVGCLHIRPLVNLKSSEGVGTMRSLAEDVVELVKDYDGALSGEHGDGRARSEFLDDRYGTELTDLFAELKTTFDPEHHLNPGNVVDPGPMDRDLRFGPDYEVNVPDTVQDFSGQGGFQEIVERCNGSAVCRKQETGTMCPSYMVTDEEKHSTRGRANALRGLMDGDVDPEALEDGRIRSVMDLCISCKACKSECPSEVDMAPLKEEVLHKIHESEGTTLRDKAFARIGTLARRLAPLQPLPGAMTSLPGVEYLTKKVLGVAEERDLPDLSSDPFRDWSTDRGPLDAEEETVLLHVDTFSGYMNPEVARAARRVLERLGFDVVVPETPCCGRPMMSKGFLEEAREQVEKTLGLLGPYAEVGVPIVTLEPSCHSVLVDDAPRYAPGDRAETVAESSTLFGRFLRDNARDRVEELARDPGHGFLLHGHCHQKALEGRGALVELLESITEEEVRFVDAGCCGMAGSFGYEAEHYRHSRKMAERKLVPAVEDASPTTRVVAPGISCRQQIRHFTRSEVRHPARTIADAILPPNGN